jgi:hypothetical protein
MSQEHATTGFDPAQDLDLEFELFKILKKYPKSDWNVILEEVNNFKEFVSKLPSINNELLRFARYRKKNFNDSWADFMGVVKGSLGSLGYLSKKHYLISPGEGAVVEDSDIGGEGQRIRGQINQNFVNSCVNHFVFNITPHVEILNSPTQ